MTNYYSKALFFIYPIFFFFEYSCTGYDNTITEAKMHDNAGSKIIVYFIKDL